MNVEELRRLAQAVENEEVGPYDAGQELAQLARDLELIVEEGEL